MVCIARTMPAQDVRLSVTRRYSAGMVKHIRSTFLHYQVVTPFWLLKNFSTLSGMVILRRRSHNGGVECNGYEKNRDFRLISRFVSETMQDRES